MIDHKLPKNWEDLQQKVAEIFVEIGYKTEIGKDIETVRGTINIDVFSVDENQSPNIVYLCECKHWERRVPKTIVQAFRTVVQDFGANFGIIISKRGFQKGAYDAARNTNINLVDWFGFQEMFEEKWLPAIAEKLYNKFQVLIDYTEPLIPTKIFKKLRDKYTEIGMAILHFHFGHLYDNPRKWKFPLTVQVPKEENRLEIIELHCFREYINFLNYWSEKALKEFNELFDESN